MLKYGAFLGSLAAVAVALVGCGSADESMFGDGSGNGSGNSGGAVPFGGAGGQIGVGGSSAGSSGGSGGGAASGSVEDLRNSACAGWSAEPENLPAVLMLIVDVSGSMTADAPGGGGSKWEVTRNALDQALTGLPGSTAVGVIYYPNTNTSPGGPRDISECVAVDEMIPIDLLGDAGSQHRQRLAQSLQAADTGGGTPTHDAYRYGFQNGMQPSTFTGNRFMLLITDGQPTFSIQCDGTGSTSNPVNEQPIVQEVAGAFSTGVRTFIIGSPGSEQNVSTGADARPWLSQAATAGGTGTSGCADAGPNFCHMDMTQAPDFGAALSAGLAQIAGQIISCDYALPPPPAGESLDLGRVNVISTPAGGTPEILPREADSSCTDGWYLGPNDHVILCSNTCAQVQADAAAKLEVLFGCKSQGPGPR
jgi:hypothetical protein